MEIAIEKMNYSGQGESSTIFYYRAKSRSTLSTQIWLLSSQEITNQWSNTSTTGFEGMRTQSGQFLVYLHQKRYQFPIFSPISAAFYRGHKYYRIATIFWRKIWENVASKRKEWNGPKCQFPAARSMLAETDKVHWVKVATCKIIPLLVILPPERKWLITNSNPKICTVIVNKRITCGYEITWIKKIEKSVDQRIIIYDNY